MYAVVAHDGPAGFLGRAEAWLRAREDLHNLMLGLAYARASPGAQVEPGALFATVEREEAVVGCVVRTPPHKVLVTDLPADAAPSVAEALSDRYETVGTVLGSIEPAEAIATAWVARRGGAWRRGMRQRIYRIDEVRFPAGVSGRLRPARPADVPLAAEWGRGFARDTGIDFPTPEAAARRWVERGALHVWEDEGVPRSVAVVSGRTPRGVRIGYVYTPPDFRGRGYASACVGSLSRSMLESGCDFCVLYTDLDNPTSNAIYRRLGYYPIQDVYDVDLTPPYDGS